MSNVHIQFMLLAEHLMIKEMHCSWFSVCANYIKFNETVSVLGFEARPPLLSPIDFEDADSVLFESRP